MPKLENLQGLATEICITFPVEPVAKGRPRMTRRGRVFTPAKTRAFEEEIAFLAKASGHKPLDGPLRLRAVFFMKRPKKPKATHPQGRPDLDNLVKGLADALNGIFWRDDSQVVEIHSKKVYTDPGESPRIILLVTVLATA